MHPRCEGSRETQVFFFFFPSKDFYSVKISKEGEEKRWRRLEDSVKFRKEEQRRNNNKVPQGKGAGSRQGTGYRDILSFLSSLKSFLLKLT